MIAAPIKKKTLKAILRSIKEAEKSVDLTEIWFDEADLKESELNKIFDNTKKPIIYKSTGDIKKMNVILKYNIQYIDLDIRTAKSLITRIKKYSPKTRIILSYHNFKMTPQIKEMERIRKKMLDKGADITKIATKATSFQDSLRMLSFLDSIKNFAICICMGKEGQITRSTGHLLGNYISYAPIKKEDKTADGQILAKDLQEIMSLIK